MGKFDQIISAGHPHKIGMYFGIALVFISLATNISFGIIEINSPFDWLFVFLIGLSIFFFFMAISWSTTENTNTEVNHTANNQTKTVNSSYTTYLQRFNVLTKTCFWIFGLFLFCALIRFIILLIK